MRANFIIVILLGVALKSTYANIEDGLPKLNIAGIEDIQKNISERLPTQEDAEKLFKEKCVQNGGEHAYERAKAAREEAENCVKKLVNVETLQEEMEKAKPSGDLDIVFKKYCKKSPELTECITNFTTAFEPCLKEEERKSKDIVLNVTESLVGFICFKEGDRIALFIAEGGPECLNSSQEAIKECIQTTYKKQIAISDEPSLQDIPALLFQADECQDFYNLQQCVVKELERCKEPTPANIVNSLFNYIRKVTPCAKFVPVKAEGEKGLASTISPFQIFSLSVISYVLLRLVH